MTSGIYRIRHKRSGAAYVGGSTNIEKRWSWHLSMLKNGKHTSPRLQKLWNVHGKSAFVLEVLLKIRGKRLRVVEDEWALQEKNLLNERTNRGYTHSEKLKRKMRAGRARYLEDPEARKSLSERAKKQHAAGNFGHSTWKKGTIARYNPKSGVAGARALRAHIASQTSAEMSKRSRMRKIFLEVRA